LLAAMDTAYLALVQEVGLLPADARDRPGACAEWSVKDILAHLDAWHDLFLGWVADADAGRRHTDANTGATVHGSVRRSERTGAARRMGGD